MPTHPPLPPETSWYKEFDEMFIEALEKARAEGVRDAIKQILEYVEFQVKVDENRATWIRADYLKAILTQLQEKL